MAMLRGRVPASPSSSNNDLLPSPHEYDYDTYEADTPTSHYSSKLHPAPTVPNSLLRASIASGPASATPSASTSASPSFDMDREWTDKGYAHEYEESSVGGMTPKMGMDSGGKPLSRRAGSGAGGSGLGLWGKGKKKRLGELSIPWNMCEHPLEIASSPSIEAEKIMS